MRWTTRIACLTGIILTAGSLIAAENEMGMKKLTPVLTVDSIEACLPFWVERLGFEKTMSVPPEGDMLAFAMLQKDAVQLMLQTRKSLQKDVPELVAEPSRSFLYIEVGDLDAIENRLEGADIVVPRHKTFYGADEITVKDPAGNVITFAEIADS